MFGATAGKGLVDVAANFDIVCRTVSGKVLQLLQGGWLNVQFPVQVLAHFLLHLVYLPQLEHPLPDYAPGLV